MGTLQGEDFISDYGDEQIDEAIGKALNPDLAPTPSSANLVTSGGVAAALAGKAPSGYGLGETLPLVNHGQADALRYPGVYFFIDVADPFSAGGVTIQSGRLISYGTSYPASSYGMEQALFPDLAGYPLVMLRHGTPAGVWSPWEWVNPPLALNTEYRTTERFGGKPVYVKTFGNNFASNGYKGAGHGIANVDGIVRVEAHIDDANATAFAGAALPAYSMPGGGTVPTVSQVWATKTTLDSFNTISANDGAHYSAAIYYTKTTD